MPKLASYPTGHYVYQLVDPRDGLPFYVGKGQRGRAWEHQRRVEGGQRSGSDRKASKIRSILDAGHDVEVEIVAQYELESDALDHEFRLVDSSPTLTNVMPGGIGPGATPKQIERRRKIWKIRKERLAVLREKEREEAEKRRLASVKKELLRIKGAELHEQAIDAWIGQTGGHVRPPKPQAKAKRSKGRMSKFGRIRIDYSDYEPAK
jgi:hypothetical protein